MSRAQMQRAGAVIDLKTHMPLEPAGPTAHQLLDKLIESPVADGYLNGQTSGKAAGLALLRYAKTRPAEMAALPHLAYLALGIAKKIERAPSRGQRDAWEGKMVGFLGVLEPWLQSAARMCSWHELKAITDESIAKMIQDATQGVPGAELKAHLRQARSEVAKAAWRRRKAAMQRPAGASTGHTAQTPCIQS